MAVYELSKLLPESLRPLPPHLIKINDTRSDIVPNSGELPLPILPQLVAMLLWHFKSTLTWRRVKDPLVRALEQQKGSLKHAFSHFQAINSLFHGQSCHIKDSGLLWQVQLGRPLVLKQPVLPCKRRASS